MQIQTKPLMKIRILLLSLTFVFCKSFSQNNQRFKLEDDHEFDKGSGITLNNLNSNQIHNLALLGKTWGFLKYHHPYIAAGNINWDYQLFRIIPTYINIKTKRERNEELLKLVNSLGVVNKDTVRENVKAEDVKMQPDLDWLRNTAELGDSLSKQLINIKNGVRPKGNYYISFVEGVGNPILSNEKSYSSMRFPDAGFRLLTLYRYWNIINYFFPYKYLIDEKWESVLSEFIPLFIADTNQTEYNFTTLKMISRIHDSHANIVRNWQLENYQGTLAPPFSAIFVGNKLVVTGYYSDTLEIKNKIKPGDIILKINHQNVDGLIKKSYPLISASNKETELRDLARSFLLKTKNDELILELLKDGVKSTITVPALLPTSFKYRQDFEINSTAPGYYLIKKDIGYLLPSKFKSKNLPEIKTLFKETKGIILDMRCYPSDYMISKLGDYIKPHRSPFVKFAATNLEQPGLFKYTLTNENGGGNEQIYTGKVVILVNERTQSLAEFTTMALQGSPNVIVIGNTTAGADGNVTHFKLPGGINTSFSGLGVYYPDGSETQRVGIKIDIPIKPTIAGIKAGRDELLEKAFELIEK